MQKVKDYLNSLPGISNGYYNNLITFDLRENRLKKSDKHKTITHLRLINPAFIREILVPFFSKLT